MSGQGVPLKLTFFEAEITHDTEMIGSMSPYLKVRVNNVDKWRSKTCKKGDKRPNFNRESTSLNLRSLNDNIAIEVWDDDTITKDDFIGGTQLKAYQLLGRQQEVMEFPIVFSQK